VRAGSAMWVQAVHGIRGRRRLASADGTLPWTIVKRRQCPPGIAYNFYFGLEVRCEA